MILDTIRKEIDDFNTQSIEVVKGYSFNQKETLNKIYLYYNSKYASGEFDDQGDKKYFDNISRNPCNVATKAIDFDTKDIKVLTAPGGRPEKTWFFERDLKFWMKDQNFGKTLNRIFHELPIYGSVVLKEIKNKLYFVDLRNFIVEQSADSLDKSGYIIEQHPYTPMEFRKIGDKNGWDNVDKTIEAFRKTKDPYIKVLERYGEVEEKGKYVYKKTIIADVGKDIMEDGIVLPHPGFLLEEKEIKTHPYHEIHFEKMPGRWLGIGRVEIIFDPQVRVNEISNQQAKSSYWSTLRLWQTRDEGLGSNLLTDVDNGDVLIVEDPLTQVDMADRNLAYYNQELQRWMQNRDEMTFSYDVNRGERMPAGTPLGSAQLAAGMVGSYFDQIRENVSMEIKELLYNVIIPGFKNSSTTEHILRIAGKDLDELNNLIISIETEKRLIEYVSDNNSFPTEGEYELLKKVVTEKAKKANERMITIPTGFYDDVKYKIDIIITGEAMDTRVKAANTLMAIQAIQSDPTMLTDPTKKALFFGLLEQAGINPYDFVKSGQPEQQLEQPRVGGGGVSKPAMPNNAVAGTQQSTI